MDAKFAVNLARRFCRSFLPPGIVILLVISGCAQTRHNHTDLFAGMTEHEAVTPAPAEDASREVPLLEQGGGSGPSCFASCGDQPAIEPDGATAEGTTHPADADTSDDFRFTAIRGWLYRNYLPDKSDPWIFGLETNSAWGWGDFDVSNISYIELADYPDPIDGMPGGNPELNGRGGTGLTDLLSAFLFSKKGAHHGPHHFSAGVAVQLPTAEAKALGSGKWSIGPAVEYEYSSGKFYAAFVALNVFSVAGDKDRKGVNMLMIKPMITYEMFTNWKAVYMPYGISVYWNKPNKDAVYVPLGAGIQHDFTIGSQKMAASLAFYEYVIRPEKGSQYDLRFLLQFDF